MCKSGVCEGWCSYEEAVWCPILETVARFWIPQVTESVQEIVPEIIRGYANWTANSFFKTWWTQKKR